ncbi:B3 domain-containing transcription factor VRN1 [Linum perenne]
MVFSSAAFTMVSFSLPQQWLPTSYPGISGRLSTLTTLNKGHWQRLSEEFVTAYGHHLSDVAVLNLPDGKVWRIGLAKENDEHRVWLKAGFRRFLQYYSIEALFLLIFEFQGGSDFHVLIFNLTGCEIVYPICQPAKSELQHSMEDSDSDSDFDFDDPPVRKRSFKNTNRKGKRANGGTSGDSFAATAENEDLRRRLNASRIITNQKFSSAFRNMSAASKSAIRRAIESNPKNPSFLISVKRCYILSGNMDFPVKFTRRYTLKDSQMITVRVFNEEERMVEERVLSIDYKNDGRVMKVSGGFSFWADNDLVEGDVCLFELIDRKAKIFALRMFHAM